MSSAINFLYEPFSSSGGTQSHDQGLKCAKCVKKEPFERRTIIIIDAICAPHELDHLAATLCNAPILNDDDFISVVAVNRSGHVVLHNVAGSKHSTVFSINELMTHYNLTKLNTSYFEKRIRENDQTPYWFDKSAHNSLKELLREICETASKGQGNSKRDKRCSGLALLVSSVLASQCISSSCCNIVSFLNGPCTKGGGKVMSRERSEHMRQNHHFDSENPKLQLSKNSRKFYRKLAEKFGRENLIYEFFISSLDQIGLLEMAPLLSSSIAVSQFDSFNDDRFDKSFQKYLSLRNQNAIYNCQSKLITTRNTSIINGVPTNILNPKHLSLPVKIPLDRSSTSNTVKFQTTFENQRQKYTRTETALLPNPDDPFRIQNEIVLSMKKMASEIVGDFDYSSHRAKKLLKQLILLPNQIRETDIDRVKLIEWCYYLYRSPLLSTRNTSLDERYLFLHQILNSNRNTCLSLCKPYIWGYDDSKQDWVVLDIPLTRAQILQETKYTLCVDGGSYLVLRMGELLQKEGREFCCRLLNDLQRFPQPLYVETKIGGSQDRFLKSKIIPLDNTDKKTLHTEDMSFQEFSNLCTSPNRNK